MAERLKAFVRGEAETASTNRAFKKDGTAVTVEVRSKFVQSAGRQTLLTVVRDYHPSSFSESEA